MPAIDKFTEYAPSLTHPLRDSLEVTPSDSADLEYVSRAIMVSAAGSVSVVMAGGQSVTLPDLQVGVVYPFRVARVLSTGTTATGVLAFW